MFRKETPFLVLAALVLALPVLFMVLFAPPEPPGPEALRIEKSKRTGSLQGHPDEFRKHFAAIEGLPGGYDPYPHNHKMMEFRRAYERAAKRSQAQLDWIERGPGTVGGRTRTVILDPDDPTLSTWYAGAVGGGVWKGRRFVDQYDQEQIEWTPLTDHLPSLAVSAMALSESNPDILYVGTGEGFYNIDAASGVGMFKTTDRGRTWSQLAATAVPSDNGWRFVNRITVSPNDPDVVVVATNGGIYRTTNGGDSFTKVYNAVDTRIQDLRARPDNWNIQFAAANGQTVLRSTDGGLTWEPSLTRFHTGSGRIELAIAPSDPNVVYAAVDANSGELYRTIDGGNTWQYVAEVNDLNTGWLGAQGWYDNTIAVHPFSPDTVYLGGIFFWKAWVTGNTTTVSYLEFNGNNVPPFMGLVSFTGANFGGSLFVGPYALNDPNATITDITLEDLTSVEVRFGQGTQKAHRFTVARDGGTAGDGGAGIPYAEYRYQGYVEVPFQVWDTDHNRQLMLSFRDQADNGVYDLIDLNTGGGDRDAQSREYVFIHRYDYSENTPNAALAADGGLVNGLLYFYWPYLEAENEWDPDHLPVSKIVITTGMEEAETHEIEFWIGGNQVHVDHHNMTTVPINPATNDFHMMGGNDGGVAYSRNSGETWIEGDAAKGYNTSQFYDATKREGFEIYLGGTQDNGTWRSYNAANSRRGWIESFPVQADGFDVFWLGQDSLLGSWQGTNIYRSLNGGVEWIAASADIPDGQFLTALGTSQKRPEVIFTITPSGIWRSQNFADSWQQMPVEQASWINTLNSGKVRVSLANPDVVWAGHYLRLENATLHLSRDGGNTFRPVNAPDMAPTAVISGLATHPWQAQTAYVMFSVFGQPKILRTTDYGETWEDLSGFAHSTNGQSTNGFPDARVYDLEVFPEKNHIIWAGTDMGLFESRDHGATWHYADNGLPAVSVWRLRIEDGEVVVATHGRGVWSLDVTEVQTRTDPVAAVPTTFTLEPNYPNPFNPTTTIGFQAPHQSHIRLTVFDGLGRKVATLTDQPYPAGAHQVDWNAAHRASGQYFYRLEADGQLVQTRSMMLVK